MLGVAGLPLEGSAGYPAPACPATREWPARSAFRPAPCRPGDGEEGCTSKTPHPAPHPAPNVVLEANPLQNQLTLSPTFSSAKLQVEKHYPPYIQASTLCRGRLVLGWHARLESRATLGLACWPCAPGTPSPHPLRPVLSLSFPICEMERLPQALQEQSQHSLQVEG